MSVKDPQEFWPRAILHVDMDAFFASVEQLDNPSLRGKPVIVGGTSGRGVVSAASYEARRYGVHSAMSGTRARMLCPDGIFLPGRMERYSEVSHQIQNIFTEFTPLVEPLSCDEAFLDVTGSQRLFGVPVEIARLVKSTIREKTGLTASVGVAPTMFVAKLASDLEKPDGLVVIRAEEVLDRLAPLPVEKLWGVGGRMAESLHSIGISTIADIRAWPEEDLERRFGTSGRHLADLSRGRDPRRVSPEEEVKSVSHETTFEYDIDDVESLAVHLRGLADKVAVRMRRKGLVGRTVQLKVRYRDFSTITRRTTLPEPCALGQVMADEAIRLLYDRTDAGARSVRLIGVGMGELSAEGEGGQVSLFRMAERERLEALEKTTDIIRNRHGANIIGRAVHLPPPGKEGERD